MVFTFAHATVVRVIDGDTFWADIDLGMRLTARMKVRLYQASAPELKVPGGEEALSWLSEFLTTNPFLTLISHEWSYDRIVCQVMAAHTKDIAAMIDVGAAGITAGFLVKAH